MEPKVDQKRRAFWLKQMHQWHWISSAVCLIGMLLFAATGITLNHASDIKADPQVTKVSTQLPPELISDLAAQPKEGKQVLPPTVAQWLQGNLPVTMTAREGELSEAEVYVSLPRPGGDAWLTIDRETGEIEYERTDRGWVSYLNDLHKGRNTGQAWAWFLDIFAVACGVFCITGLFLLQLHAGNRPATWPIVGLGLVIPVVLAIVFIH